MFLEHVNLTVADLQRSVDFYTRVFGFAVRWQGETSDGKPAAHVGDDRSYLALFQARDTTPLERKSYDRIGLNHFGFVVNDIDAIKKRLREAGITHHSEQTYDPGRHVYFLDPDGIEVELVQYAQGESSIPAPAHEAPAPGRELKSSLGGMAQVMTCMLLGMGHASPQLPVGKLHLPI